jgi:hypothetical protein
MNGITLEVIWFDNDMTEVLLRCSNGYFSGQAEIYLANDGFEGIAQTLRGFPSTPSDSRDIGIGTFNPEHADGGARMHFHCLDSPGHAAVDVQLRGDGSKGLGEVQSVALRIPIEAAAIDRFIQELRAIDKTVGARATLHQTGRVD